MSRPVPASGGVDPSPVRKVLLVDSVPGFSGGAERSLLELARALPERGWAPELATWRDGDLAAAFRASGIPVHTPPEGRPDPASPLGGRTLRVPWIRPAVAAANWLRIALRDIGREAEWLAGVAEEVGAGVAHTNCDLSLPAAERACRAMGIPLVAPVRDHWRHWFHPRIAGPLRRADVVVSPSRFLAGRFEEAAIPSRVVPNPVSGDRLARPLDARERERIRQELDVADFFSVATIGRLDEQKGAAHVVDAARHGVDAARQAAGGSSPYVRFLLAGKGTPEQVEGVRARIREAGVEGSIRLLGFRDDVPEWLPAMDALLAPGRAEPFGRTVVEGMLAGLPVVAYREGAHPELIRDGETGILAEPGDPAALGAAVRTLHDAPDAARAMGEEGRREALRRFRPSAIAGEVAGLYEEISGSRAADRESGTAGRESGIAGRESRTADREEP